MRELLNTAVLLIYSVLFSVWRRFCLFILKLDNILSCVFFSVLSFPLECRGGVIKPLYSDLFRYNFTVKSEGKQTCVKCLKQNSLVKRKLYFFDKHLIVSKLCPILFYL